MGGEPTNNLPSVHICKHGDQCVFWIDVLPETGCIFYYTMKCRQFNEKYNEIRLVQIYFEKKNEARNENQKEWKILLSGTFKYFPIEQKQCRKALGLFCILCMLIWSTFRICTGVD